MALRPDRRHVDSDISFFCNSVLERGGIVCLTGTWASGAAMDQAESTVDYVANPSGCEPVGVLMTDVENLDLTRQRPNWEQEAVQVGGKVNVWTKCVVVTDRVYPGHTPTPGQIAYVGHSGYFASSDVATDHTGTNRKVGRFLTRKNEDGFCKIEVNLPQG